MRETATEPEAVNAELSTLGERTAAVEDLLQA
jgi:hypothetical protein